MPAKRIQHTIEPPQLAAQPKSVWIEASELQDGMVISEALISDADVSAHIASDLSFDRTVFKRANMSQTEFSLFQLLDARLDGCDLAGASWAKAHLQRAEFVSCRMVGMALLDSQCDNLLIQRCNADAVRFWNTSFRATRFEHCSFKAASFEGADLSGVVFRSCDLTNADLRRAKLKGADIRGCTIEGMQVGVLDLKGLIVGPAQAVELAALFGVVVQPEA